MSKRQKIFDYIKSKKASRDGWVKMTNAELAENIGMSVTEVQQLVGSLKATGNVDTLLVNNRVQGFKIIKQPSRWRRGREAVKQVVKRGKGRTDQPQNVVSLIRTPMIDRYGAAKETFDRMISDEAVKEHVEATWRENPMAEEGLSLKQQLDALRERHQQLQTTYNEEHRELEYLRTRNNEQLREGLRTAGVEHAAG